MNHSAAALLLSQLVLCAAAFGQGSLTPPGAPAPTMKTLDQIEARKPIPGGTAAYTISASGSYYLTGNITVASGNAITVGANNVTLDLNGFTLATTSTTPSGTAIFIKQGVFRCAVMNGFIQGEGSAAGGTYGGGGFQDGVNTEGPVAENIFVHDLVVNGCSRHGIYVSSSGYGADRVENCSVENVGDTGIAATIVRGCTVFYCVRVGISANGVADCFAEAQAGGISAATATNCTGRGNSGVGIDCTTARGCSASSVGANALNAVTASDSNGSASGGGIGINASTAVNCRGGSGSSFGVFAVTATTCYGTSTSGVGLQTGTGTDCVGSTKTGAYGAYANSFTNSQGVASGSGGSGLGAYYSAMGCLGISQDRWGLVSTGSATNCFGQTSASNYAALIVDGTANSCRGYNLTGTGSAIGSTIAIGCSAQAGYISGAKFLGTP